MGSTEERRKIIRKLLLAGRGGTQSEICALLLDRGLATTQSTISRDLKRLDAERTLREDGSFVYRLRGARRSRFPAEMVLSIANNETMIVVRTRVGRAPAVGVEIDTLRLTGILGTISGDDTVLVIPTSVTGIPRLLIRLREISELEL